MTSFERTNYCNHSFSTFKQQHSNLYMIRNIAKKRNPTFQQKSAIWPVTISRQVTPPKSNRAILRKDVDTKLCELFPPDVILS